MKKSTRTALALTVSLAFAGCSSTDRPSDSSAGSGGSTSHAGGSPGGAAPAGGSAPGGNTSGGAPSRGGAAGAPGGSAGSLAGSGAANGGGSGSDVGGTAGVASAGGGGATTCALPSVFKWTSGGPIATPKNGAVALKDFSQTLYNGRHVVYLTTHDQSNWGSALMTFDDWADAASATQTKIAFGIAPTLFYFTPKKQWILAYQWGPHKFSYRTSSDPTDPSSWSGEQSLYNTALPPDGTGPIDQTLICDKTTCFLFYAGDNGHIYHSSLPIGSFPGTFPAAKDSGIQGTAQNLFEAVQVYSVKGSTRYLMIVEAQGNARYFRAWTATDLAGPWTLLTDNFASKSNVTFSTAWTNDISHGDLVRDNPDETFSVDPCKLQFLFQGRDPSVNVEYGLLPYRMGLLTLQR